MTVSLRCFATVTIAIALYGISIHALWACEIVLPGLWRSGVFAAALVGAAFVTRTGRVAPVAGETPGTRRAQFLDLGMILVAVAVVLAPLLWSCWTETSREWDGYAVWELRARHLARDGGLYQAFFLDPAVYSPTRGYPLLQPLMLSDAIRWLGYPQARLLNPALFALLLLGVHGLLASVLRRRDALLGTLAVLVFPFWVGTGAGSVDSGYAELLLSVALVAVCAGLWGQRGERGDALRGYVAVAGFVMLPLVKPEGLVYGVLALFAGIRVMPRALFYRAAIGFCLAATLGTFLRSRLVGEESAQALLLFALPLPILLVRELLARGKRRAMGAIVVAGVLLTVLALWATSSQNGPLRVLWDGAPERLAGRIAQVPEILAGLLQALVFVRKYALLWVLLLGVVLAAYLARRDAGARVSLATPNAALGRFVVLGLIACVGALFLVPVADLEHEFRSRFDRLLLQWTTPAWLLVLPCVFAADKRPDSEV